MTVNNLKPIPGYSCYQISEFGQVYNSKRDSFLQGSPNPDGYINFRITNDLGVTKTWGLHRLLGFVFLPFAGSIDDLVINHKDGVKWHNDLVNLEWVTYQGNAEHAGKEGLTTKCIPILVRCVDTGEITSFNSIIDCARKTGFTKDAINYRIRSKGQRVFPERKQYMAANSDESWMIPECVEKALKHNGRNNAVLVRYLLSDNYTEEFKDQATVAKVLGVLQSTVTNWLSKEGQPVLPGYVQLKLSTDPDEWREIGDIYLELEKTTGKRVVVVWNDSTTLQYDSAIACAVANGLTPTSLNYRLSIKGEKVFRDGMRYAYYSDFIEINNKVTLSRNV